MVKGFLIYISSTVARPEKEWDTQGDNNCDPLSVISPMRLPVWLFGFFVWHITVSVSGQRTVLLDRLHCAATCRVPPRAYGNRPRIGLSHFTAAILTFPVAWP